MTTPEPGQFVPEDIRRISEQVTNRGGRLLLKMATAESHIGSGIEKDVFDMGNGRVIAFFARKNLGSKYLAAEMKSYYYAAKIAHIIAPENIPEIFMASSQPPALVSEFIAGEVSGAKEKDFHDRHALRRKFERFGLQDGLDYASANFIRTEAGGLAYIDIVNPFSLVHNQDFDDYVGTLDPAQQLRIKGLQEKLQTNLDPFF